MDVPVYSTMKIARWLPWAESVVKLALIVILKWYPPAWNDTIFGGSCRVFVGENGRTNSQTQFVGVYVSPIIIISPLHHYILIFYLLSPEFCSFIRMPVDQ